MHREQPVPRPAEIPLLDCDLERFEAEQADLEALCAPRNPKGDELLVANEYYGSAKVLKRYAGYADDRPIKAVVPHGVYLSDTHVADYERHACLPAVLAYPQYRVDLYKNAGMFSVPSAAPFVYADRLLCFEKVRQGTLFFPAHSLPGVTAEMDFDALGDMLLGLPREQQPVSVMVYWQDYLLGRHRPFLERGLRVLSAGHIYDPRFLLRLAYFLKCHSHVISNSVGSHLFYSLHSGCSFRLIDSPVKLSGTEEGFRLAAPDTTSDQRKVELERAAELFRVETDVPTREQTEFAAYYLGFSHVLEPLQLHELLSWLERLDTLGPTLTFFNTGKRFEVESSGRTLIIPMMARRFVLRGPRAVEALVRRAVAKSIHGLRTVFPLLKRVRLRRGK